MEKFQGWTPTTIDNLTFDQLEAIFKEFTDRQSKKMDKDINLKNIPSAKGTKEEIDAWTKTGMKGGFQDFVSKRRKGRT